MEMKCTSLYYVNTEGEAINLINSEDLNQEVKLFKDGNSYAFKLSQKDREFLNADDNTLFEKIISPDGKEVTFRKIEKIRPNIIETADKLFDKNTDLMKRLENL